MKTTLLISLLLALLSSVRAQAPVGDNCSNTKKITVCPQVDLTGETTAGYTNDRATWKYSSFSATNTEAGNDMVYEIAAPAGAKRLLVTIKNASAAFRLYFVYANCSMTSGFGQYNVSASAAAQCISITLPATAGPFFLWVDHNNPTDISYDITFGCITNITSVNFTKGVLQSMAGCMPGSFKQDMEITYNGNHMNYPLVYPNLGTPGVVCVKLFFRNLSGSESIRSIRFTFDADLQNPSAATASMPGFYNTGTWNATQAANVITWTFADAAGIGKGDFTGTPNNCLTYTFCFNITPVSNNAATTNVKYVWTGDNWGPSKSYTIYEGCSSASACFLSANCPTLNCTLGSASSGAAATGSGGFNDPFLPVTLLAFTAENQDDLTVLNWSTALEDNSDMFEVERSADAKTFSTVGSVKTAGSNSHYEFVDAEISGTVYYRLKIVDNDGTYSYSSIIKSDHGDELLKIYPNPAKTYVNIENISGFEEVILLDVLGKTTRKMENVSGTQLRFDLSGIEKGLYYLSVTMKGKVKITRIIIE